MPILTGLKVSSLVGEFVFDGTEYNAKGRGLVTEFRGL